MVTEHTAYPQSAWFHFCWEICEIPLALLLQWLSNTGRAQYSTSRRFAHNSSLTRRRKRVQTFNWYCTYNYKHEYHHHS